MACTTLQIAEWIDGELTGPTEVTIAGLEQIDRAQPGQMTFVGDAAHARQWPDSNASALLLEATVELPRPDDRPVIRVRDVDLALVRVLEHFAPPIARPEPGVHATAVIDPSATLGKDVSIGPHVHVGPRAHIGDGCQLHAHVVVLDEAVIGERTVLWPHVVVRDRCRVGADCILHAGVVIGGDGFGYRPAADGSHIVKIPQIGTVELGDHVEIGANSCVDRGKFAATVIGDGCKLDNLVQIGHNCRIGRMVLISGQTGVGGSTCIQDGALLGGACDIADHLTIGRGVKLAGGSQLMHDIPDGETWAGSPAGPYKQTMRLHAALRQLPDLMREVKKHLRG